MYDNIYKTYIGSKWFGLFWSGKQKLLVIYYVLCCPKVMQMKFEIWLKKKVFITTHANKMQLTGA